MESTASKRRDIIKNITIVFLIVMLVLTFFSSTILNYSLPEVAAQYAYGGQIVSSVRVNGTTEANENYQVIIEEGRIIESVNVRRGDLVEPGDVLFVLEDAESMEMQDALNKLNEASIAYDKWKLQTQADIDDQMLDIRYAKEDLQKIRSKGVSNVNSSAAEKKVESLRKELASYKLYAAQMAFDQAEKALHAAQDAFDIVKADYDAKNEVLENLQNSGSVQDQLLSAERELEDMSILLARAQEEYDAVKKEHDEALEKRAELKRVMDRAKIEYEDCRGNDSIIADNIAYYEGEVARLQAIPNRTPEEDEALTKAAGQLAYYQSMQQNVIGNGQFYQQKYEEAKAAYEANEAVIAATEEQLKTMGQNLEDQTRSYTRRKEDYEALKAKVGQTEDSPSAADYNAALKDAQKNVKEASRKLEDKQMVLTDAQTAYDTAKETLSAAKREGKPLDKVYTQAQIDKLVADTEQKLEDAQAALEELQQDAGEGYPTIEAYNEAVTAQQRSIDAKEVALKRAKENNKLDEPSYKDAVTRAKEEVRRMSDSVGAPVIKAKVGGTINNISVSAGQTVEAQTVLAEIEQQDRGYTVNLSVTAEQAKRLAVGQPASVMYYWGDVPEAVIESIRPSKSDPQNTREVVLQMTGDITAGQSFTFSLGEKSANYDNVVPNSAIREDSNGKFVLVVNAKNTPIGNRYTAARMDIDVITSDETNSAVSGLLGGEFVITTSTEPIAAGQQVRLSENG